MALLDALARRGLLALPPEMAHEAALRALEAGAYPRARAPEDPILATEVAGLRFPNPLGIAAGFDKDARAPNALLDLGFGFAEVGTVTPEPQPGNPRPRVFRLCAEEGVINRLGFNSGGHAQALRRLTRQPPRGIVGVNIGANRTASDRAADYARGILTFSGVASYFMINVSSPNTPGLRDLQQPALLDGLLAQGFAAREQAVAAGHPRRPVFVKLSPDMAEEDLPAIAATLRRHPVDGVAMGNTTLSRARLASPLRHETGGLSGRPLFQRSTSMLAKLYRALQGALPLIGIGGVDSGPAALAKIEAGASLVQLYTALIYKGPGLIADIKAHLAAAARRAGVASSSALVGSRHAFWANAPLNG